MAYENFTIFIDGFIIRYEFEKKIELPVYPYGTVLGSITTIS